MIAYLAGTLLDFSEKSVIIATPGGVGYEVTCPASVIGQMPGKGQKVELFIHTVVAEKAIDLYGFLSLDEREVFRTLISIDKLGPKKAVAILSSFTPDHLREIAFREDDRTLSTVPGIGPKSAKQILWHLKDKVDGLGSATGVSNAEAPSGKAGREYLDALAGLKNLGYAEGEARPRLKAIFESEPDLDAAGALRTALKQIASSK